MRSLMVFCFTLAVAAFITGIQPVMEMDLLLRAVALAAAFYAYVIALTIKESPKYQTQMAATSPSPGHR